MLQVLSSLTNDDMLLILPGTQVCLGRVRMYLYGVSVVTALRYCIRTVSVYCM